MKYSFKNDYSEGCHPRILEALLKNNLSGQPGYGEDEFCKKAAELIKTTLNSPGSEVFFCSGGTQANIVVIAALLRPHESVISTDTGHIFNNEAGAIEATGHKVHALPTADGKLKPAQIEDLLKTHHNVPHQVKPKLVYISNATELGTIYTRQELKGLHEFCRAKDLILFMDGARLSQALAAETNDVSNEDLAKYTDVFYWGGTKNGALLGEAIIINTEECAQDFGFNLKQRGALLAKGRLLGTQFLELFTNDLHLDLAKCANGQAMKIKNAFTAAGFSLYTDTYTNQLFPVLLNSEIEKLREKFDFYIWKPLEDEEAIIRLITSWATSEEAVDLLCSQISALRS